MKKLLVLLFLLVSLALFAASEHLPSYERFMSSLTPKERKEIFGCFGEDGPKIDSLDVLLAKYKELPGQLEFLYWPSYDKKAEHPIRHLETFVEESKGNKIHYYPIWVYQYAENLFLVYSLYNKFHFSDNIGFYDAGVYYDRSMVEVTDGKIRVYHDLSKNLRRFFIKTDLLDNLLEVRRGADLNKRVESLPKVVDWDNVNLRFAHPVFRWEEQVAYSVYEQFSNAGYIGTWGTSSHFKSFRITQVSSIAEDSGFYSVYGRLETFEFSSDFFDKTKIELIKHEIGNQTIEFEIPIRIDGKYCRFGEVQLFKWNQSILKSAQGMDAKTVMEVLKLK